MADEGDQFSLTLDLQAQNTKAVLLVVEGYALNEAGEAVECGGSLRHGGMSSGSLLKRHVLD